MRILVESLYEELSRLKEAESRRIPIVAKPERAVAETAAARAGFRSQ